VAGSCEYVNEDSGLIKGGGFLDQPSDYHLVKYSVHISTLTMIEGLYSN
jgi:hypothetical protein